MKKTINIKWFQALPWISVAGVIATAVCSSKVGMKAEKILNDRKYLKNVQVRQVLSTQEILCIVMRVYIPMNSVIFFIYFSIYVIFLSIFLEINGGNNYVYLKFEKFLEIGECNNYVFLKSWKIVLKKGCNICGLYDML